MEKSKEPAVYYTEEEWKEKGFIIMHGQKHHCTDAIRMPIYSNHQVKPAEK